jgi:3-oxoacyl-[acyl-carrier-protein] synthase II
MSLFDVSEFPCGVGAEVKDLKAIEFTGRKSVWALSRSITLGFAAARLALADAGIALGPADNSGIGVVYGTTLSGLAPLAAFDQLALREGPRLADPLTFPSTGASAPACQISIMLGLDAFNTTLSNGQSSSLDAIRYASQFIQLGRAHTVIAGGVEEICKEIFVSCYRGHLLAGSKSGRTEACRPFDYRRSGTVLGEGGAALILEDLDHALRRNATIYAGVAGHGSSFDPSLRMTSKPKAAVTCMQSALREAKLEPSRIDAVFASANGSRVSDRVEMQALRNVFSDEHLPATTAAKSMLGESYSASGAIQSAIAVLALKHQAVPGTVNFERPDPTCPVDSVVKQTVSMPLSHVMVNAFGHSGNHASLVLSSYEN